MTSFQQHRFLYKQFSEKRLIAVQHGSLPIPCHIPIDPPDSQLAERFHRHIHIGIRIIPHNGQHFPAVKNHGICARIFRKKIICNMNTVLSLPAGMTHHRQNFINIESAGGKMAAQLSIQTVALRQQYAQIHFSSVPVSARL